MIFYEELIMISENYTDLSPPIGKHMKTPYKRAIELDIAYY